MLGIFPIINRIFDTFEKLSTLSCGSIWEMPLTEQELIMINRLFLDHPRSVDETYIQHMAFAGKFSLKLFAAGFCALIHAIIPCAFEKTASRLIADMYAKTHNRG